MKLSQRLRTLIARATGNDPERRWPDSVLERMACGEQRSSGTYRIGSAQVPRRAYAGLRPSSTPAPSDEELAELERLEAEA